MHDPSAQQGRAVADSEPTCAPPEIRRSLCRGRASHSIAQSERSAFQASVRAALPAGIRPVQGVWLCGAGLAIGLAGGLASGRLLGRLLYGVAPNDLYTVLGVVVFRMITSVAASYVPARRATRPDVLALLRDA
jgi:hypothetical protein